MKKLGKKKEITMDDLAAMTQRGFDGVDQKFDGVDRKFDGVDQKFDGVDQKFENMQRAMHEMEERLGIRLDKLEFMMIGRHDKRLDKLEDDMRVIKTLLEKKLDATFPK